MLQEEGLNEVEMRNSYMERGRSLLLSKKSSMI
jgi:hypothetical protein